MNLRHFELAEKGVYKIVINDYVGSYQIQGSVIANEIAHINSIGAKRIDMEINSEGGGIIDGVRIGSAMIESQIPIKTINKGYALSIAGVFYMLGEPGMREMVNFGLLMVHNPQFRGEDMNDIIDPKKHEIASRMKKQLMQLMLQKNKQIPEETLSKMMDEETWMNCDEAKKHGLVNKVIKHPNENAPRIEEASTMPHNAYVNSIKDYYCSLEQNNTNINTKNEAMEDLKKQYEARLTEKDNSVKELTNSVSDYKNQVSALKKDLTNLTQENEKTNKVNEQLKMDNVENLSKIKVIEDKLAVDLVNEAIEDGKFKPEKRETLIENAKANINSFKNMVEMIPGVKREEGKVKPKISEMLEMSDALTDLNKEDLGGKTRYEFLMKNDAAKLEEIKIKQPEVFKALKNEYVNKYAKENK